MDRWAHLGRNGVHLGRIALLRRDAAVTVGICKQTHNGCIHGTDRDASVANEGLGGGGSEGGGGKERC
jgi:hypothetical protein